MPGNAIGYAKHHSRSHDAVISVYDAAGKLIEVHRHKGDFNEPELDKEAATRFGSATTLRLRMSMLAIEFTAAKQRLSSVNMACHCFGVRRHCE